MNVSKQIHTTPSSTLYNRDMTTAVPHPHASSTTSTEFTTPPPHHPSRRKLLARIGCSTLAGGLAVGGGLTWAYGPGGPLSYTAKRLKKLKNDPMGKKKILGHEAIQANDSPLPKWFEQKYPGLRLRRWFRDNNTDPKELKKQFIEYAEHHGWENDPGPTTPASWVGRHGGTQPIDDMFLAVYLSSDDPTPPPNAGNNSIAILLCYF